MVSSEVLLALVTMIAWGLWLVFAKLATQTLLPQTTTLISYVAAVIVTLGYIALGSKSISPAETGTALTVLVGIASAIGVIISMRRCHAATLQL